MLTYPNLYLTSESYRSILLPVKQPEITKRRKKDITPGLSILEGRCDWSGSTRIINLRQIDGALKIEAEEK